MIKILILPKMFKIGSKSVIFCLKGLNKVYVEKCQAIGIHYDQLLV